MQPEIRLVSVLPSYIPLDRLARGLSTGVIMVYSKRIKRSNRIKHKRDQQDEEASQTFQASSEIEK